MSCALRNFANAQQCNFPESMRKRRSAKSAGKDNAFWKHDVLQSPGEAMHMHASNFHKICGDITETCASRRPELLNIQCRRKKSSTMSLKRYGCSQVMAWPASWMTAHS